MDGAGFHFKSQTSFFTSRIIIVAAIICITMVLEVVVVDHQIDFVIPGAEATSCFATISFIANIACVVYGVFEATDLIPNLKSFRQRYWYDGNKISTDRIDVTLCLYKKNLGAIGSELYLKSDRSWMPGESSAHPHGNFADMCIADDYTKRVIYISCMVKFSVLIHTCLWVNLNKIYGKICLKSW